MTARVTLARPSARRACLVEEVDRDGQLGKDLAKGADIVAHLPERGLGEAQD